MLPGFAGSATTVMGLIVSLSREAALTFGGVREAAAQPIAMPILPEDDPGLEPRTGDCWRHTVFGW